MHAQYDLTSKTLSCEKEQVKKDHIFHDFIYGKCPEMVTL
jgi:hypothetical protein